MNNISDADILVVKELKLDKNIINKLSSTAKLICEAGTGYNNIDIEECKKRNINISDIPNYSTNTVALFILILILNMSTSFHQQEKMILNKDFSNFGNTLKVEYKEIGNKALGIIGMSKIGSKVSQLESSLGMKVIYYSKEEKIFPIQNMYH